ncbi:MAG TPA: DUF3500 domain-containing protein [Tepidisphaeraceae bacterium]|jgi:hypothetical protein
MSDLNRREDQCCPDCGCSTRREFLKTTAGSFAAITAASSGLLGAGGTLGRAGAAQTASAATSETLVQQLYGSLSEGQRKLVCFPFDDPLRSKVDNNWHIIKQPIGQLFSKDQRALIREIFLDMHSEEYAQRVMGQVEHDNAEEKLGGFDGCAVALFGEPGEAGKSKFEFVFTGRHVTRRCDGNSVEGEAFGGPIFYGHAAQGFNEKADHPGNIYWYQAKRANELFQALDGKQRKIALRDDPRTEQGTKTVALQGRNATLTGIPLSELTADQKQLAREVMADVLAPFRKTDAAKAMKLVEAGGLDNLHMTFYSVMDIGNDGVWDLWQIEGQSMVWYFRGAPHVHTWVHIRDPQAV